LKDLAVQGQAVGEPLDQGLPSRWQPVLRQQQERQFMTEDEAVKADYREVKTPAKKPKP
jgi:hypothetical protein